VECSPHNSLACRKAVARRQAADSRMVVGNKQVGCRVVEHMVEEHSCRTGEDCNLEESRMEGSMEEGSKVVENKSRTQVDCSLVVVNMVAVRSHSSEAQS
jgi:hypothetical protein